MLFAKKIMSVGMAVTLLFMSGCSGRSGKTGGSPQAVTGEMISTDKLGADIKSALSQEYDQFVISDNCVSFAAENLYECEFVTKKDFSKNYSEVFQNTAGITDIKKEYLTVDNDYMGDGYVYDDPETRQYAAISDSGFVSFFNGEMYHVDFNSFPIKALYINGSENWSGDESEFEFNGLDFSVEESVEISKRWINEHWVEYEPDFDFVPSHIFKLSSGESDVLAVVMNKYYNGVKLSSCDKTDIPESAIYERIRNSQIKVYITGNGEVCAFTTCDSSLSANKKSEIGECISLSDAFAAIEESFSEYNKLDVISVNLKYILSHEIDSSDESYTDENVADSTELVWEFLIKPYYPDFSKSNKTSCANFLYINVNAITGEINFELDSLSREMAV